MRREEPAGDGVEGSVEGIVKFRAGFSISCVNRVAVMFGLLRHSAFLTARYFRSARIRRFPGFS